MFSFGDPVAAAESVAVKRELGRRRVRRPRSEQALIRGILAGSEADLEALFRRYWPRAYRTAFLIVHDHAAAEDIAQEAHGMRTLEVEVSGPGSGRSSPTGRSTGC